MRVPTTSDGTRSGVNCNRENVPLTVLASVSTARVLATPGTPSSRQWPRASRLIMIRSTMRSWPTITRLISNMTRSRAPASAAGVETVSLTKRSFRVFGVVFTVRDVAVPCLCAGSVDFRRSAAVFGQGLPRSRNGRSAVAQSEAARRHARQALAGLPRPPRPPGQLPRSAQLPTRGRAALTPDGRHGAVGLDERRGVDAMAGLLARHRIADDRRQLVVGSPGAKRAAQVGLAVREQAGAQLSVSSQP